MKANPPNQFRFRNAGAWSSSDACGMNGAFQIPLQGFGHRIIANCIVSDGTNEDGSDNAEIPWEHVSVHIVEYGKQRIPTWSEMCAVKDLFWEAEETVIQFHPAQSQYVNNHPHVLHLWKFKGEQPHPPEIAVGIKSLGCLQH